jgi:hypothetical protein
MEKDVRKSTYKLNKLGRHEKPHIYLYNLYRCNPLKVVNSIYLNMQTIRLI